jgi:hypothetical protein
MFTNGRKAAFLNTNSQYCSSGTLMRKDWPGTVLHYRFCIIGFAAFAEGPCTRLDNDLARLSGLQITAR